MTTIIQINHLSKDYVFYEKEPGLKGSFRALFNRKKQVKQAVKDFNLSIDSPDIVGLIGPNGAGKTTLIKMLTGIIKPTSGSASVLGYDTANPGNAYKRKFSLVMGQKSQLWWDLPAVDTFSLNKAIYEIPEIRFKQNLEFFSELFSVGDLLHVPVRQLSLGERMKMELISSLLHDPLVLFLDEPTIGLDAAAQTQMRELLKKVRQEKNVTILLTSHYMKDIKSLCERVLVIRQGAKIYDGSLELLSQQFNQQVTIHLNFNSEDHWQPPEDVLILEQTASHLVFQVQKEEAPALLNAALTKNQVSNMRVEERELEDMVEQIYQMDGLAL